MSFTTRQPVTLDDVDETLVKLITAISVVLDVQKLHGEMISKTLAAVTRPSGGENKLTDLLAELVKGQARVEQRLDELVEQLKAGRA